MKTDYDREENYMRQTLSQMEGWLSSWAHMRGNNPEHKIALGQLMRRLLTEYAAKLELAEIASETQSTTKNVSNGQKTHLNEAKQQKMQRAK